MAKENIFSRGADTTTASAGMLTMEQIPGMPLGVLKLKEPKELNVINNDGISANVVKGIVRLYQALAPGYNVKPVNVKLIHEKALPRFKEMLGNKRYDILVSYFGLGKRKLFRSKKGEIEKIVSELRTLENAQYYLEGFAELLEKVSNLLVGAPENMPSIVRAKLVRVYATIFWGGHFFAEDYIYRCDGINIDGILNMETALKNEPKPFGPEEMFSLWELSLKRYSQSSIMLEALEHEIEMLARNVKKALMTFAELAQDEETGEYYSVNSTCTDYGKYASVRALKKKVVGDPPVLPIHLFIELGGLQLSMLDSIHAIYRVLQQPWEEFPKVSRKYVTINGNSAREYSQICYNLCGEHCGDTIYSDASDNNGTMFLCSGDKERARFINTFEKLLPMYDVSMETMDKKRISLQAFWGAIKLCKELGYVNYETTSIEREWELITAVLGLDNEENTTLKSYFKNEITTDKCVEALGITPEVEAEVLGIKPGLTVRLKEWAVTEGFVPSVEAVNDSLIENVLFAGGARNDFEMFLDGRISEEELKESLGFDDALASMYFSLKAIDGNAIESALMEAKSKRLTAKNGPARLTILLYCYLVEQQVPCGSKDKPLKGNKSLKVKNLRNLILID